ncbi:MAG: YidC/Oxa1 family membrane protein insertase [Acholeplasmataceae bacterium]|jgi:YidC/Oxa1 family membrane protein insertase|nr:YidC/Oxa1 family membrane protein insertase [Acholeplasmataceae bacterium]
MKTQKRKYLLAGLVLMALFFLSSCSGKGTPDYQPIAGWNGIIDILVWPMAGLMYGIGKTVAFGYYGLVIIVATIIVRTLAWPIYAKTNDMSLKMQLMAPDQAKIEARYAGKTDPESNQRKQMELMQLYKKYGVGIGGCLLPLIQFPIFIAFYQTLQRVPVTILPEHPLNFGFLKTGFLGIDLFQGRLDALTKEPISTYQTWGIIVLAALVGITQILSQILATRRQKKLRAETQSNIPAYRQTQQTDVQKQTETTMKIMMYGMTVMMVIFVYQSTAALGLYWLVGNIYSTLQAEISAKTNAKRMEKLKSKIN